MIAVVLGGAVSANASDLTCADKSVTASGIRERGDVHAFVQCAHEFVEEVGFDEAYRAFHNDPRWLGGPIYIFVDELLPGAAEATVFVHPAFPHIKSRQWGTLVDSFGTDIIADGVRIVRDYGDGWWYYAFTNSVTGLSVPKVTYIQHIAWRGIHSMIGAGIYPLDAPGTRYPQETSADGLAATPSHEHLEAFVRCAAHRLAAEGYAAKAELASAPRWHSGSIYLFGLDLQGNEVLNSNPVQANGVAVSELGASHPGGQFGGRDTVGIGAAFGGTYLYYRRLQSSCRPGSAQSGVRQAGLGARGARADRVGVLPRGWRDNRCGSGAVRADKTVAARGVRTPKDMQAFVQCAHEFVQEVGVDEAKRAFEQDERWTSGPIYTFVRERLPLAFESRLIVFPPDPAREGSAVLLEDALGADAHAEQYRVLTEFGEGWTYYSFQNPATDRISPKASYIESIDWNGRPAFAGAGVAGVYLRDLPDSCAAVDVNAGALAAEPSMQGLEEFVRCAAQRVERQGLFAKTELEQDPRWSSGSVYVFGLDAAGGQMCSGGRGAAHEWSGADGYQEQFQGRDVLGVIETFGEAHLYY